MRRALQALALGQKAVKLTRALIGSLLPNARGEVGALRERHPALTLL
jgi:hypothetical protein